MGAWRKAGVWLGLVEDEDDRVYDDDDVDDDFAMPIRPRTVRPAPRSPDRSEVGRDRTEVSHDRREDRDRRGRADRTGRDRGGRDRDFWEPRDRDSRLDSRMDDDDRDAGLTDLRADFDRDARSDRDARTERTVRDLRTERPGDTGARVTRLPDPRTEEPRPATVRPLLRPTAGSTALSVPAQENLSNAPQVQLRERAAASDDRLARRYEITTLHPTSYSEARAIGEQFRDGHPVIMNLTDLPEADAKRLVDFAAGLAFGLRGSIERVTNRVFLLTPPNIRVSDEDRQRIAETGLFDQR